MGTEYGVLGQIPAGSRCNFFCNSCNELTAEGTLVKGAKVPRTANKINDDNDDDINEDDLYSHGGDDDEGTLLAGEASGISCWGG